jgi:hypothetical protein
MVLYLCVLIVFSLHRESLKLILAMNPFSRWFCHTGVDWELANIVQIKENPFGNSSNASATKGLSSWRSMTNPSLCSSRRDSGIHL